VWAGRSGIDNKQYSTVIDRYSTKRHSLSKAGAQLRQQYHHHVIIDEGPPISHDLTEDGYEDIDASHSDGEDNLIETSSLLLQPNETRLR